MKALNNLYTKMNNLVHKYHTDPTGLAGRLVDILDEAFNIGFSAGHAEDYGFPDDCNDDYPDPMESADEAFDSEELEREACEELEREAWYDSLGQYDEDEIAKMQDAEEIDSWANTPHDNMNIELKQIDKEIEDRRIDKSIWAARELMMDKIIFSNGDSYPIHSITWDVDDNNIPVDIIISSRKKYLDCIAEKHCQLGYNYNDEETHGFHEALYGRLDKFYVVDYEGKVILTPNFDC